MHRGTDNLPSNDRHSEAAFEAAIEAHLLQNGYIPIARDGFDRNRAIFPATVLAFIRETQPAEWAKLKALHGDQTGDQVLTDLCKWMDANGSLATLRHGFKCYGRTLHAAFFKAAHELNPELEARYAANRLDLTRQLRFSPQSEKSLGIHTMAAPIGQRTSGKKCSPGTACSTYSPGSSTCRPKRSAMTSAAK